MRSIVKVNVPTFYEKKTRRLDNWKQYYGNEKRRLKEFILSNEQQGLCIYCERQIDIHDSHIEHIEPQCNSSSLIFEYTNLVISCNGDHNELTEIHHCGHKKAENYNGDLFLNPLSTQNLDAYFKYETDENQCISIAPRNNSDLKAEYMINLLNLNCSELQISRKTSTLNFMKLLKSKNKDDRINFINAIKNGREKRSYISLLRYLISNSYNI